MRRERGFVGMSEILSISAIGAVLFVGSLRMKPGEPGATYGFAAAMLGAGVVAGVLCGAFAAPERPRYYDPGSAGCLAMWVPQIGAIVGLGTAARAIATTTGHGAASHWFALGGALLGAGLFVMGCRAAWRVLPAPRKDAS